MQMPSFNLQTAASKAAAGGVSQGVPAGGRSSSGVNGDLAAASRTAAAATGAGNGVSASGNSVSASGNSASGDCEVVSHHNPILIIALRWTVMCNT